VSVLTIEQEQAVERRREPLLLAAGAGSGKTSVLVERFVRAVREDGLAPARILAITFTERAAGELRERVRRRLQELGERAAARDTEAAFVSTFHGFCARLLRAHPLLTGLDPQFAILEEGLAELMRERAFRGALGEFVAGERSEAVDLLAAYGADRVRSIVQGVHAELRSRGQCRPRLPELARAAPDLPGAEACALLDELLGAYGHAYEALKRRRGTLDFDDLELLARELLQERAGVREAWSERFEMLMVDEFQDTNPRQLAILQALDRGNLFTVGDELQSIYGFRHADVSLFRARRAELEAGSASPAAPGGSLALVRNFRSPARLLDVVNAVFERRFGAEYRPLVAADLGESDGLHAAKNGSEPGSEPLVELLLTDKCGWEADGGSPPWRRAEARMLAARVAALVDSGQARAGDVVVLLRALGDLEVYERALNEHGLLTLAAAGGFWGRQQVGDLLAYLRALANPLDEKALYSTLASPLVGCSSDGLALLARAARSRGRGQVWETIRGGAPEFDARLAPADREALVAFRNRFEAERATASRRTISQLIERAIEMTGYRGHVLGLEWGQRRLANVHKLLGLARRFEASEGRDLRGFLDYAAAQQNAPGGREADAPVAGVEPDAVRLMSIHAAKGLEFGVVCVADLGRAQNVSVPDLLVDGDRVGLRLVGLDGSEATPALDFEELSAERKRAQAQEEDRILYVAMTRARERLLLSGTADFERWPDPRQGAPTISWLAPALSAELPARVQSAEQAVFDLQVGAAGRSTVRCRLNAPGTAGAAARPGPGRPDAPSVDRAGETARESAGAAPARPRHIASPRAITTPCSDSPPPQEIATLSYTTLGELERCGYRYYLERVLGMPENRTAARGRSSAEGMEARARGTLVHRLLELVDFARSSGPAPQDVARVARELGLRVGRSERAEIAALVGGVLIDAPSPGAPAARAAPAARVRAAEQIRREHPFAFSLGAHEPLISGVIDLLAREVDGGWLVLDYKSDRVGPEEDLDELVERSYGAQRMLYALAVLRDGAPTVEIVHWFLERPAEWVATRYAAADAGELEKRLAERIQRARAGGFVVAENPHRGLCETCPGRGGLCSWSDAQTLAEAPGGQPADEPRAAVARSPA
jgi:ATP-dependent helicase/nuclease subunit A